MALSQPSASEVRLVIQTTLTDQQIDAIVDDAVLMVEACPVVASYSAAKQKAILRWLAAHLIASTNSGGGSLTSKKLGDAQETYARPTMDTHLNSTTYGQQALALDPSGCLANLGKPTSFFKVL